MERFPLCLIGGSVGGSPSQAMLQAALSASGRTGPYDLISVDADGLAGVLLELRAGRWRGANVTIPHKMAVAAACDELVGDARVTGAVNTVTVHTGGRLVGDNTDAVGFELALAGRRLWPAPGSKAVVVGAGGAAAAVGVALSRVPVASTTVVAQRLGAAQALVDRLAAAGLTGTVRAVPWPGDQLEQALASADIVVNATPAGLAGMPFTPSRLRTSCTVADVRYRPRPVDVVEAAERSGRRGCDGVDMLFHQGMLSFRLWTGEDPAFEAARRALERAIDG